MLSKAVRLFCRMFRQFGTWIVGNIRNNCVSKGIIKTSKFAGEMVSKCFESNLRWRKKSFIRPKDTRALENKLNKNSVYNAFINDLPWYMVRIGGHKSRFSCSTHFGSRRILTWMNAWSLETHNSLKHSSPTSRQLTNKYIMLNYPYDIINNVSRRPREPMGIAV